MNYLSHFYLERDHPSEYYKLGLIFPDLIRNSHPKLKLRSLFSSEQKMSPEADSLKWGIARHFEMDKRFHSSDFFKTNSEKLKIIFKENGFDRKELRLFFLSHILTEILLDRLLLFHDETIGSDFYNTMEIINPKYVQDLFTNNTDFSEQKFKEHFSRFTESRYLLSYTKTEAIFYAINRISRHIGLSPFNEDDFIQFEKSILIAEENMRSGFQDLFAGLK